LLIRRAGESEARQEYAVHGLRKFLRSNSISRTSDDAARIAMTRLLVILTTVAIVAIGAATPDFPSHTFGQ
jgi:hypothetical protein